MFEHLHFHVQPNMAIEPKQHPLLSNSLKLPRPFRGTDINPVILSLENKSPNNPKLMQR